MEDVTQLSDAELDALRVAKNAQRAALTVELRVITAEQSARGAHAKAAAFMAGLSPAERDALKGSRRIAVAPIATSEAVGDPGK